MILKRLTIEVWYEVWSVALFGLKRFVDEWSGILLLTSRGRPQTGRQTHAVLLFILLLALLLRHSLAILCNYNPPWNYFIFCASFFLRKKKKIHPLPSLLIWHILIISDHGANRSHFFFFLVLTFLYPIIFYGYGGRLFFADREYMTSGACTGIEFWLIFTVYTEWSVHHFSRNVSRTVWFWFWFWLCFFLFKGHTVKSVIAGGRNK